MKVNITKRTYKYLTLSSSIKFSTEEFALLDNILKPLFCDFNSTEEQFDMWFLLSYAIHDYIKTGYCYETYNEDETFGVGMVSETRYVPLTFIQYLLVNFKRVFFFIALVPLDSVPLYMNDPFLEPFAKWRLTISK